MCTQANGQHLPLIARTVSFICRPYKDNVFPLIYNSITIWRLSTRTQLPVQYFVINKVCNPFHLMLSFQYCIQTPCNVLK